MSLLKSITLLLVAALANPMCCCLVGGEMDSESPPAKSVTDAHACCHSTEQTESDSRQTDRDCYHEDIKLTQINDVNAHSQSIVPGLEALFIGYQAIGDSLEHSLFQRLAAGEYRPLDTHSPPGSRISHSHCVYLI